MGKIKICNVLIASREIIASMFSCSVEGIDYRGLRYFCCRPFGSKKVTSAAFLYRFTIPILSLKQNFSPPPSCSTCMDICGQMPRKFFSWSPVHTMFFFFCINLFCVWREIVPSAVFLLYFDHKTNTYYHHQFVQFFFLLQDPLLVLYF